MERRKAIQLTLATIATGGVGAVTLTNAFKPDIKAAATPEKLEFKEGESAWKYTRLDPEITAEIAYNNYPDGSCMYGVFSSVISQLAEKIGEPFASFPSRMMKYGHGGVNGSGTICGSLNGAAALIGLLVEGKGNQDALSARLFHLYENSPLPAFEPKDPGFDYSPPTSTAESVLCHASNTRWSKASGLRVDSKERKERCRRLTADIAAATVEILNEYHDNAFMANSFDNETVRTCMSCHGKEGKVGNTSAQMNCNSCHTESTGHRLFGDVHYKLMNED